MRTEFEIVTQLFSPAGQHHETADVVVGCDGAFSAVRKAFVRNVR